MRSTHRFAFIVSIAAGTFACGSDPAPPPPAPPATASRPTIALDAPSGPIAETTNVVFTIDTVESSPAATRIDGWAFIDGPETPGARTSIVLRANAGQKVFAATTSPRPDVAARYRRSAAEPSGFSVTVPPGLPPGEYRIGIYIEAGDRKALQFSDRFLRVG